MRVAWLLMLLLRLRAPLRLVLLLRCWFAPARCSESFLEFGVTKSNSTKAVPNETKRSSIHSEEHAVHHEVRVRGNLVEVEILRPISVRITWFPTVGVPVVEGHRIQIIRPSNAHFVEEFKELINVKVVRRQVFQLLFR